MVDNDNITLAFNVIKKILSDVPRSKDNRMTEKDIKVIQKMLLSTNDCIQKDAAKKSKTPKRAKTKAED
jgi:hypothetical protein